ncbi:MAG: biotin--[acetyl-CoA-carboxylase] ligase [Methylococcales bacterium]|nr:biotin--[acetyl-CoA-carboxylase] ligase [Methylococcales bacterium]
MTWPIPLLNILADGQCHPLAELSQRLAVTEITLKQWLEQLPTLGVYTECIPDCGYRLDAPIDWLDADQVTALLPGWAHGLVKQLEIHPILKSTNAYLIERHASLAPGVVCAAEWQSAGRGRRGRHWCSPFAANIYMSCFWRYPTLQHVMGLSLAVGVAVVQALQQLDFQGITLKWPNDIYYQQQKLGGVLIETTPDAGVVVGLGLNVRMSTAQAQAVDQPWTALHLVAGAEPGHLSRNYLLATLVAHIMRVCAEFAEQGLAAYLPAWRRLDGCQGRWATLRCAGQTVEGRLLPIDEQGLLGLETADGEVHRFASGEISHLRSQLDAPAG